TSWNRRLSGGGIGFGSSTGSAGFEHPGIESSSRIPKNKSFALLDDDRTSARKKLSSSEPTPFIASIPHSKARFQTQALKHRRPCSNDHAVTGFFTSDWCRTLSRRRIRPSSSASGRGGHPGT